tara:strand:+ start:1149 stop:1733 length:585 start_codon:yes stop_codon:yes gene_type:complete
MEKIGLLFGSFNPVHKGHISIAKHVLDKQKLSKVFFILSPLNPFKIESKNILLDADHRYEILKIAIKKYKNMIPSDIEFGMKKPNYTFETLTKLENIFPKKTFYLIMGSDNFKYFNKWKNYKKILTKYKILIYPRYGEEMNSYFKEYNSITFLRGSFFDVSSDNIRKKIKSGNSLKKYISKDTITYIKNNNLYV